MKNRIKRYFTGLLSVLMLFALYSGTPVTYAASIAVKPDAVNADSSPALSLKVTGLTLLENFKKDVPVCVYYDKSDLSGSAGLYACITKLSTGVKETRRIAELSPELVPLRLNYGKPLRIFGESESMKKGSVTFSFFHSDTITKASDYLIQIYSEDSAGDKSESYTFSLNGQTAKNPDEINSKDWMKYVDGRLLISEINIPGDSAPRTASSLDDGLSKSGLRYFDIKINKKSGSIYTAHDSGNGLIEGEDLSKTIDSCRSFLRQNPSETVLLQIGWQGDFSADDTALLYKNYIYNSPDSWYLENELPSLNDVRGKIVLLRKFELPRGHTYSDHTAGIDLSDFALPQTGEDTGSYQNDPFSLLSDSTSLAKSITDAYLLTNEPYVTAEHIGDPAESTLWPYSTYVEMLANAVESDPGNDVLTAEYKKALNGIKNYQSGTSLLRYAAGYGGYGDVYYDDNMWIALIYCKAYLLLNDTDYLSKAESVAEFCYSGWDDVLGGGIYWCENFRQNIDATKNTCSNAPMILICAELYNITKDPLCLDRAKRIYDWTRENLLDYNNLYIDHLSVDGGRVDWLFAYNAGLMISAGVKLYEQTGDDLYLAHAILTADANDAMFYTSDKEGRYISKTSHGASNHVIYGYVDLYPYYNTAGVYLKKLCSAALTGWDTRNEHGFVKDDWNTGGANDDYIVVQTGMANALFSLYRFENKTTALSGGMSGEYIVDGMMMTVSGKLFSVAHMQSIVLKSAIDSKGQDETVAQKWKAVKALLDAGGGTPKNEILINDLRVPGITGYDINAGKIINENVSNYALSEGTRYGWFLLNHADSYDNISTAQKIYRSNRFIINPEFETVYIKAAAGKGGSISNRKNLWVEAGEEILYNFTPDSGYKTGEIKLDGRVIAEGASELILRDTFTDHTLSVVFYPDSRSAKEDAEATSAPIALIGTVTYHSAPGVYAARESYNRLSDTAKAEVKNIDTLEAAEMSLSLIHQSFSVTVTGWPDNIKTTPWMELLAEQEKDLTRKALEKELSYQYKHNGYLLSDYMGKSVSYDGAGSNNGFLISQFDGQPNDNAANPWNHGYERKTGLYSRRWAFTCSPFIGTAFSCKGYMSAGTERSGLLGNEFSFNGRVYQQFYDTVRFHDDLPLVPGKKLPLGEIELFPGGRDGVDITDNRFRKAYALFSEQNKLSGKTLAIPTGEANYTVNGDIIYQKFTGPDGTAYLIMKSNGTPAAALTGAAAEALSILGTDEAFTLSELGMPTGIKTVYGNTEIYEFENKNIIFTRIKAAIISKSSGNEEKLRFLRDVYPIRGDANDDNELDIVDMLAVRNFIINFTSIKNNKGEVVTRCDVNDDGNIDITDMLAVRNMIIEK